MIDPRLLTVARDMETAVHGWLALHRARVAQRRHPELGEVSAFCFYATKLRVGDLASDIGANHREHMAQMLNRGAKVVALEELGRYEYRVTPRNSWK